VSSGIKLSSPEIRIRGGKRVPIRLFSFWNTDINPIIVWHQKKYSVLGINISPPEKRIRDGKRDAIQSFLIEFSGIVWA
jgi:hypothetical protein